MKIVASSCFVVESFLFLFIYLLSYLIGVSLEGRVERETGAVQPK